MKCIRLDGDKETSLLQVGRVQYKQAQAHSELNEILANIDSNDQMELN